MRTEPRTPPFRDHTALALAYASSLTMLLAVALACRREEFSPASGTKMIQTSRLMLGKPFTVKCGKSSTPTQRK